MCFLSCIEQIYCFRSELMTLYFQFLYKLRGGGLNRGRGLIKFSPFLRGLIRRGGGLNRGRGLNRGNTVVVVQAEVV